jgi:hypothetical protein
MGASIRLKSGELRLTGEQQALPGATSAPTRPAGSCAFQKLPKTAHRDDCLSGPGCGSFGLASATASAAANRPNSGKSRQTSGAQSAQHRSANDPIAPKTDRLPATQSGHSRSSPGGENALRHRNVLTSYALC